MPIMAPATSERPTGKGVVITVALTPSFFSSSTADAKPGVRASLGPTPGGASGALAVDF